MYDPNGQSLFHKRVKKYLKYCDNDDYLDSNFTLKEIRKIKTFAKFENNLKARCAAKGVDYDPPSDEFDYNRRQRLRYHIEKGGKVKVTKKKK